MKLIIFAIICSIAALTCANDMGNSAVDDVKNASSVSKGKFALNDMKSADWFNDKGIMPQGNQLGIGAALQSSSKRFRLNMQSDGNLVLYKEPEHLPIWHTNTVGRGGFRANLQHDGNFVVYTERSVPIWNSRTQDIRDNFLILQNDGNLVIYATDEEGLMNTNRKYAQWSSGTHGRATNLRTESLNSTSVVNIGATMTQEALPYTLADIVHVDNDPHSACDVAVGAPDQASNRALDGIN